MTKNNEGIFGGGNGFIILILFLLMLSGNWGGLGGNNNVSTQEALTRAELYEGLNSQDVKTSISNLASSINTGFDGVIMNQSNGFNGVQSSIADSNYRMADCCCQIKTAIHEEGEETRALIQNNTIQELRDSLQDAKNENLVTGLVAAQTLQTNNLENFMRTLLNGCSCGCSS